MIKIFVFIDWLIYYYIDTTQRDGSYQKHAYSALTMLTRNVNCFCYLQPRRLEITDVSGENGTSVLG